MNLKAIVCMIMPSLCVIPPSTALVNPIVDIKPYYDVKMDYDTQDYLFEVCEENGVDKELMLAIIKAESEFDNLAKSDNQTDGNESIGICQLNETYEDWYGELTGLKEGFDIYNCENNILAGVKIFKNYLDYWNEVCYNKDIAIKYALMSYNRGISGTKRFGGDISEDEYVVKVLKNKEDLKCIIVMNIRVLQSTKT